MRLNLVVPGLLVLYALAKLCDANPQFSAVRHQIPQTPSNKIPRAAQNFQNPIQIPRKITQDERSMQSPQVFMKPLKWQFPPIPEVTDEAGVEVDLLTPAHPDSLRIQCEEKQVLVEVDLNFFQNGQFINPADITLGGCAVVGEDLSTKRILFQSELHACGSVMTTTSTEIIYSFTVMYTPQPYPGTNIYRTSGAIVGVRCHYQRNYNVSSGGLIPVWRPYYSVLQGEDIFLFNLKLMTENFANKRYTVKYYLGESICIEASVVQFYHVPLRVYVESCVASATEDPSVAPYYGFIENYGCMTDAKITGSQSRFMTRTADDKLQFILEAFRFQDIGTIYITCKLKATAASTPTDSRHKACSYIGGRWSAAEGPDDVCTCCESSCAGSGETPGSVGGGKMNQQSGELWVKGTIGPISIKV